ncbi:DNA-3-methyladenine glycosylase I [Uliginosibacterium sp. 31-12]|uniref:DNA-3-methyladenine glycosylase I n=1 Tax=Uliginosibacterium sp. 31-12 TaxID=3062781 RepID=UPI0026E3CD5F|nr:DNA-3-methyladenine glycosylase I [Uliginosibacterium sp. 31-12]MDO6388020.1 DNA-3-methyladenine glycosylase I [Uliginosibacterium sp. 31-12]
MSAADWQDGRARCAWLGTWAGAADPLYRDYHDQEWGIPCRDERHLFEMLCLEGAQAGLAWITILKKREGYRHAFHGFDIARIAAMTEADIEALMQDARIVRNRAKITATIGNARAWLALREREGDVVAWLWRFVGNQPRVNHWSGMSEIPARTPESDALSKALLKAGFKFVGSTICYAFMQATGMVNDHTTTCFCHPDQALPG